MYMSTKTSYCFYSCTLASVFQSVSMSICNAQGRLQIIKIIINSAVPSSFNTHLIRR